MGIRMFAGYVARFIGMLTFSVFLLVMLAISVVAAVWSVLVLFHHATWYEWVMAAILLMLIKGSFYVGYRLKTSLWDG